MPSINPITWLKLGGALVGFGLIVAFALHLRSEFEHWRQELYNTGYKAGVTDTNLTWQTASTKASQQNLENALADGKQSRAAVAGYLQELQELAPKLKALSAQRITYVSSPAGAASCLDADGVRLIAQQRAALGFDAGSGATVQPASTTTP